MRLAAMLLTLAGCSGSGRPPGNKIRGLVTYGDQPIQAGEITFDPDPAKGNKGPQGVVKIEEGHFETLPNRGSVPGAVLVTVRGQSGEPHPENPLGLPLFPSYQLSTDLPDEDYTHDIDVPAERGSR